MPSGAFTRRTMTGALASLGAGIAPGTAGARDGRGRLADVLIIGAGTAGCILANRLSADPRRQVVLIEAGGPDGDTRLADPQAWPALIGGAYDWGYQTAPQAALDARVLAYPRGKVLGGSSSINALGHQRGHPAIFDAWGCSGWGYADLLPYFRASEAFDGGADAFRGAEGPISVVRPAPGRRSPFAEAFIAAAQAAGHGFNADFNGAAMEGVAWNQFALRAGRRESESTAYLHPVLARPNLTVLTRTQVLSLDFAGDRCLGVRVLSAGQVGHIQAGETLLCAGAIDSPRLLMLSGIGEAAALAALGVRPRVNAPGVGRDLQDHPLCGIVYEAAALLPASHYNHGEAVLFARSGLSANAAPDIQIMAVDAPFTTAATRPAPAHAYSLVPCLMQPHSRGRVTLVSADPLVPARIDPNYLADPLDVERFLAAVRLCAALGEARALAPWRAARALPGPSVNSRSAWLAFVRKAVSPFFHPVGTCRMGADPGSVVDLQLRVRGVAGLRVIDASVMPIIPDAMPNAAIAAVAEKAAALIVGAATYPVSEQGVGDPRRLPFTV
jgi:choline dehydrogenase